ncbi:hypothetical protein BY996DRAFT_7197664, partial [Phakopsora pachyrhizi]
MHQSFFMLSILIAFVSTAPQVPAATPNADGNLIGLNGQIVAVPDIVNSVNSAPNLSGEGLQGATLKQVSAQQLPNAQQAPAIGQQTNTLNSGLVIGADGRVTPAVSPVLGSNVIIPPPQQAQVNQQANAPPPPQEAQAAPPPQLAQENQQNNATTSPAQNATLEPASQQSGAAAAQNGTQQASNQTQAQNATQKAPTPAL